MSISSVNSQSTPLGRLQAAAHAAAQQARTTPKLYTAVNQAVEASKNEKTITVTQETFQKALKAQLAELQEQFAPLTSLFKRIEDFESRNTQSRSKILEFQKELETLNKQASPSQTEKDRLTQGIEDLTKQIEARQLDMQSCFKEALSLHQEIGSRAVTECGGNILEPYKQAKAQIEPLLKAPLSDRKDIETLDKSLSDFQNECIQIDRTARESLMKWALRLEVTDLSSSTFAVWKNNTSHLVMNSAPITALSQGWKGIRDFAKNPFNVVSTLTTGTSLVDATLRHLLSPSYGLVVAGGNLLATPFLASSSLSSAYEKGEYKKLATLGVSTLAAMGYPLYFQQQDEATKEWIREKGYSLLETGVTKLHNGVVDYLIPSIGKAYNFATETVIPGLQQIPEWASAIQNKASQFSFGPVLPESISDDAKTVLYVTAGAVSILGLSALGFYLYQTQSAKNASSHSTHSTALVPASVPAQQPVLVNLPKLSTQYSSARSNGGFPPPPIAYIPLQGQSLSSPANAALPASPSPALQPADSAAPASELLPTGPAKTPANRKKCASLRGRCTKISKTQVDLVAAGGFAIASVGAAALAAPIATAGLGVVALTAVTRAALTWWKGKS